MPNPPQRLLPFLPTPAMDGTGRPGAQPETVLIAAALPRARRLAAVVSPVGRPADWRRGAGGYRRALG